MRTVDVGGVPVGDGHPPRIMGVLNMSVESNYDPSVHGTPEQAVEFAEEELIAEGADIIDVGLQSSNPKNDWLPPETELERLDKALAVMDAVETDENVAWSIETRYSEVAERALDGGFDLVNDVCGWADPKMPGVCEDQDAAVIKMASPPDIKSPGHLKTIDDVFEALQRGGFTDKTIIDPAFGGWYDEKTYEDNWEMFRRLREFRAFGRPIVTATNREDFLGDIADRPDTEDQLPVSLAAATMEVERGAHIIRTHDVAETRDVALVAHHLGDDRRVADDEARVVELTGTTRREVERSMTLRDGTGDPEDGATLSFLVGELPDADREALVAATEDAGGVVGLGDGDCYLTGTVSTLREVASAVSGRSEELSVVAGEIRAAAGRHT
ncbi:dihydropteroate synthase [Natronomonas halophila]|uniref:dihydropteroate synthase n=1 Tax=Natronomonas halophila TaxID=2747817 RepID=UPI0015B3C661|nr:dihydropteroate synthase [Natronomonas halophila]QLD84550.1 dihydropteroate synthase [Natronomonas halophila]